MTGKVIGPAATLPRVPTHDVAGRPKEEAASAPRAERPDGAPTLWDLLTPEEREFFSGQIPLRALTYRPGVPREAPGPIGQRIDVKG